MSTATIAAPAAPCAENERLAAEVINWMIDRGVRNRAGYDAAETAERVVAGLHAVSLWLMIRDDDSAYLRNCCEYTRDDADLSDAQWAALDNRDGHGLDNIRTAA